MRCTSTMILYNKLSGRQMRVPCGQCINCRLNKARQWSIRVMHEAKKYDRNVFLTLTYDDEHIPVNRSLSLEDFQKFMKRFRKAHNDREIRYFACGEYGDRTFRPHYHIAFFNVDFNDFYDLMPCKCGFMCRCDQWNLGLVHVGELNIDSANYVAGYILKKQTGKNKHVYEAIGVIPPFSVMSRRPGVGFDYVLENDSFLARNKFVVAKGIKYGLPRYYKNKLEEFGYELEKKYDDLKHKMEEKALKKGTHWMTEFKEFENQLLADSRAKSSIYRRNTL